MGTMRIDCHAHSSHSDGTDTPAQLMYRAREANLDVVALTDHDVTSGWDEAMAAVSDTGVGLVRGMEMSCSANGITVHLLSYLHDPDDQPLRDACTQTLVSRATRARRMVDALAEDFPITWDDVLTHAPATGPIGRPHIADALVAAGVFRDRNACFAHVLHPRGPYYRRMESPDPVEATRMIRAAGGVPVIAHPRARSRQRLLPVEVIAAMAEAGLAGIECFHPDHEPDDVNVCLDIAASYNLEVTGSSDYHGRAKPNRLGQCVTDPGVFERLMQQGKLEVIYP